MGEDDAGNRLRTLVKAVSDDLWIAVATFEVYAPTAFDAALILEATIPVIQQLHGLIGSPDSLDYRAEREAWRARAESFWKSVGGALV